MSARDRALRAVRVTAIAAAITNAAAAIAMVTVLRPGLPGEGRSLDQRWTYVLDHPALWRAGWATWNLAAIALLALVAAFAIVWRDDSPVLALVAALAAAAGLAADLAAESMLMIMSPAATSTHFLLVEQIALTLTGFVANGLYTLALIALVVAGRRSVPLGVRALFVPVAISGIALSGATVAGSPTAQAISTAVLMPSFVVWCVWVARWTTRAS